MIQNGFFCVEHGTAFSSGNYKYSYMYENGKIYRSDSTNLRDRRIAYIVYCMNKGLHNSIVGGVRYHTSYQEALWAALGQRYTANSDVKAMLNPPIVPFSSGNASIVLSDKLTMSSGIGSLKISSLSGTINSINVTLLDENGQRTTRTISSGSSGDAYVGFFSDAACRNAININNIRKGTIYLKNLKFEKNYKVESVTFKISSSGSGYYVSLGVYTKGSGTKQKIVKPYITYGSPKTASTTVKVDQSLGSLKINKQNEDGKTLAGVRFKIYCEELGKWVAGDGHESGAIEEWQQKSTYDGTKTWVDDISNASSYTTDPNGQMLITNLYAGYTYDLIELESYYDDSITVVGVTSNINNSNVTYDPNGYVNQYNDNQICSMISGIKVYDSTSAVHVVTITDESTKGDLIIEKTDSKDSNIKLSDVEMVLYSVDKDAWVGYEGDETVETYYGDNVIYTDNISEAKRFKTDENGQILIEDLDYATYKVYEIKAPEGYDITKQDGYASDDISQQNKWVYLGEVSIKTSKITYTFANKKIVDKLEGMVWVDKPDTKENVIDNIYTENSNDYLKANIPVSLYDKSGNLLATTTTDTNGYYAFTSKNAPSYTGEDKNIYYWDLANTYVEFTYNNKTTYKQDGTVNEYGYIAVDPFAGTNVNVNSKAQEYNMTVERLDDNNLTGMTGNNKGRAVTYGAVKAFTIPEALDKIANISEKIKNNTATYDDLKEIPLMGYYDNNTYKVSNINLGLMEQNDPGYNVDETLAYIKVKMKGYTYTYKYGDAPTTTSSNVPTINEQNSAKTFTGKIYPTDIAYNIANSTEELQVYAVYKIDVKNTETTYIDNKYVEERLYIDSLVNSFDTNRYELCTNENNEDKADFALWKDNGNGTASYDVNNNQSAYKDGMGKQETKTSYIQFKIKNEALQKILTGGLTYEDIESAPTIATATGYHEYLRTDNLWIHDDNVRAFNGCKGASTYPTSNGSGKKYYVHKSINKSFSSADLYLKLSLGDARTLSGTVFEDTRTEESIENNTGLGNGILDDNEENRAKDVTVELLNADKTTITKLYQEKDGNIVYNEDGTLPDAITKTEAGGTFKFEGVVPGYYYIRFTYGDGTQKMMPAEDAIKSRDYKSTIINTADNNSIIKNAMEASTEQLENAQQILVSDPLNEDAKKLLEWYKYLDKSYSTAVDDIDQRLSVENYIYKEDGNVYDEAGNLVNDYPGNISSYTPMTGISIENDNKDYTDNGDYHSSNYNQFNFGIIKEIEPTLTLEKKITNVSFVTQTGSTIVSANPTDKTASYITALDNITGGSKYAKIEIDPTLIYGSELETTYEITIHNNTAKDYIEEDGSKEFGDYYKYGEITSTAKLKKIKVNEVIDEIDGKYNYDSTIKEVVENIVRKDGSTEQGKVTIEKSSTTETNTNSNDYISMKGWSELETQEQTSIAYTVTSLLSSEEDDTLYINKARIVSLSFDKLTTLSSKFEWGEKLRDSTTLTITPTTGEDRSNMYWIIGTVALVALFTGLILIKKKILK